MKSSKNMKLQIKEWGDDEVFIDGRYRKYFQNYFFAYRLANANRNTVSRKQKRKQNRREM